MQSRTKTPTTTPTLRADLTHLDAFVDGGSDGE
jgi:hypothetical protein